ncbi:MAG: dicarboxylate/amino acid:cation symporter [Gammaproteobacteria bacterium]|jgi:DAACS family dicarboxylate/amino acid:cation (Na+ or H+) symporter
MTLTTQILMAMVAGAALGVLIHLTAADMAWVQSVIVNGLFEVVGAMFVSALKMMVVPLVFVSLVGGVTALGDLRTLGRVGGKAVLFYLATTAVAISIALSLAVAVAPGEGFQSTEPVAEIELKAPPALEQVLIDLVPSNPVAAMANGSMLQVIVFALLFGVAVAAAGEGGRHVLNFFNDLNAVIMRMVDLVMKLAPIGVFALIAKTFATQGADVLAPLLGYFLVVIGALLVHSLGTFSIVLYLLGRLDPMVFYAKLRSVLAFAFSTASSNATIPVTLKTTEERLGVSNSVAAFTVPLGATINMDGTAIMQGVATVFIAEVYGIDLGFADYLTVILTATLASIGTAGVPGVGLIMLAMVLGQVGLPVEGIALIIGVDRLLDMLRTATNVTGDCMVTCLVAKSEGALDEAIYYDKEAGLTGSAAAPADADG